MPELWARCAGFPAYEVSTSGRVRRRHNRRLCGIWYTDQGYASVSLQRDGHWHKPRVHKLVWHTFRGPVPDGLEVDHRDRDRGNPRLRNLRLLTKGQNCGYARRRMGTSGYRGVRWYPRDRTWAVRVGEDHVGYFKSKLLAAIARDVAAVKRWGKAAVLNFPRPCHA